MTRTVTIQFRQYTVVDEPRLNGEIAPHLYDEYGDCVGALADSGGLDDAPEQWSPHDVESAIRQIVHGGECGLCFEPCEACSPGGSNHIDQCSCACS